MKNNIYLDYNATAPIRPVVRNAIQKYIANNQQYNPSSAHNLGRASNDIIENARHTIQTNLNFEHMYFTSGATESNNIVTNNNDIKHVFYIQGDHPSISNLRPNAKKHNIPLLSANHEYTGLNYELLNEYIKDKNPDKERGILSISLTMSCTGITHNIKNIKQLCNTHNIQLHCDITQTLGKHNICATDMDIATFSGHKIGALQGIGAICSHEKTSNSHSYGGFQEYNARPGTQNVIGILSLQHAIEDIYQTHNTEERERIKMLRNKLAKYISKNIENIEIPFENCINKSTNTIPLIIRNVNGAIARILFDKNGLCVSYGSACASGAEYANEELVSLGISAENAKSCIRISIGYDTTEEEIDKSAIIIKDIISHLNTAS